MAATIFVDESGDLGWNFNAAYNSGGSSRYLTIGAVVIPEQDKHLPGRLVRDLYKDRGWNAGKEKKWVDMSPSARIEFAARAVKLVDSVPGLRLFAMTVNKLNVMPHLRDDPNLLYNYMMKLLLCEEMAKHNEVVLIPDPRTIKVASGNSQHDYLQITLWYDHGAQTKLHSRPIDSKKELGIQFADMLCGAVQSHQELAKSDPWKKLSHKVKWKTLFF